MAETPPGEAAVLRGLEALFAGPREALLHSLQTQALDPRTLGTHMGYEALHEVRVTAFEELGKQLQATQPSNHSGAEPNPVGGTFAAAAIEAYYVQGGQRYPVALRTLSLDGGRITGRGRDGVGKFRVEGTHSPDGFSFLKTYIGQHSVKCAGHVVVAAGSIELRGRWEIMGSGDEMLVKVRRPQEAEGGPAPPPADAARPAWQPVEAEAAADFSQASVECLVELLGHVVRTVGLGPAGINSPFLAPIARLIRAAAPLSLA
eukprot:EG_transcript_23325